MSDKMNLVQKKVAILAELNRGEIAAELAIKYNVNPMTIGKWKREARQAAEKAKVLELEVVEPEVLETVIQEVREKAKSADLTPKQYRKLDAQLDKVSEGVSSLQMLDTGFHNTMLNLLEWANDRINDDMKVSEWTQLVNGISTLHSTLFSKGATNNINIMQNNTSGNTAKVEKFKGGFRA